MSNAIVPQRQFNLPHFTGDAVCAECGHDLPAERIYQLFCDDTCRNRYQANVAVNLKPLSPRLAASIGARYARKGGA